MRTLRKGTSVCLQVAVRQGHSVLRTPTSKGQEGGGRSGLIPMQAVCRAWTEIWDL